MIRGVAFDLEGTAIDVEFAHFEAFRLAAAEIDINFSRNNTAQDIAYRIPNAIGGGDALIAQGISRLSGGRTSVEWIRTRKDHLYNEIMEGLDSIEPRAGFLEIFEQIRGCGLPVAIASLTERRQAKVLLSRSGIGKLFPPHLILLQDSVKNPKPAPDVYLEAARRMGIQPSEQLVFEDSVTGITAARRAGSCVVAMPIYTFPAHMEALKKAGPVEIFTSWTEIDSVTLAALLDI